MRATEPVRHTALQHTDAEPWSIQEDLHLETTKVLNWQDMLIPTVSVGNRKEGDSFIPIVKKN